ncbi:MAG: hypothetical protein LWX11_05560 [Firmicutes bacterium]|nr:hypothetical protein [Bacillota bacterium]
MKGILILFAMSLGGAVGWWLGSLVGLVTAVLLSAIGSGLGVWTMRWVFRNWME